MLNIKLPRTPTSHTRDYLCALRGVLETHPQQKLDHPPPLKCRVPERLGQAAMPCRKVLGGLTSFTIGNKS